MKVKLKIKREISSGVQKIGDIIDVADEEAQRMIANGIAEAPGTKEKKAVKNG